MEGIIDYIVPGGRIAVAVAVAIRSTIHEDYLTPGLALGSLDEVGAFRHICSRIHHAFPSFPFVKWCQDDSACMDGEASSLSCVS